MRYFSPFSSRFLFLFVVGKEAKYGIFGPTDFCARSTAWGKRHPSRKKAGFESRKCQKQMLYKMKKESDTVKGPCRLDCRDLWIKGE